MARGQARSNIKNKQPQPPLPKDQGKRPRGVKKQPTPRKSLRLQAIRQSHKQSLPRSNHLQEVQAPLSPPASNIPEGGEAPQRPQTLYKPSTSSRKRKRGQEEQGARHSSSRTQEQPPSKRLHIDKERLYQAPATDISEGSTDPLQHWIDTGKWRKEYFEQDNQVREDFERGKSSEEPGRKDWLQEYFTKEPSREMQALTHSHHFFARPPLSRKESQSLRTSNDQSSQGSKSSQYNTADYEIRLERKGSYMREYDDIDDDEEKGTNMKTLCKTLLEREQTTPQESLFRDDLFKKTCEKVRNRNEAIVVQDITRLIVPSVENLAIYGAKNLNHLYESVNEAWSNMNSYEGTLPQPDYSVGFRRSAFTEEQLNKLKPFVGEPGFKIITYFMATTRIYFPFFTCEVKCGAAALDIADRQNAQSMSVALRALVVLFRYVKREQELDREILVFSVSHDDSSVRIYGHYPVIEEDKTTFYRHPIRKFDFTEREGEEKWTTYKFVKNVYDHHMPKLHKLICSAIDDVPVGISFDLSQSASFFQSTPQSSQQSHVESVLSEDDSQSSFLASQEVTPTTSFTQATEPAFKKPRNKRASER